MKRALICGIQGQDGSYLAELLLNKGYVVYGTSRDPEAPGCLPKPIRTRVDVLQTAPDDPLSVRSAIERSTPDEVYALAGQSSVGRSFEDPSGTLNSVVFGTLNLLEAIRAINPEIRLYHASSSECFGDLGGCPATEAMAFRPRSPYAVAKASAHMLVQNYREAYGLFAVNGLLFNHESPRRPQRFVTRKIVSSAKRIAGGSGDTLHLGRIDIVRDWGWAPEYVDAMWRMLQSDEPVDYVIGTGVQHSVRKCYELAFEHVDLDPGDFVKTDKNLQRPAEVDTLLADAGKAERELGWKAEISFDELVAMMVDSDMEAQQEIHGIRPGDRGTR